MREEAAPLAVCRIESKSPSLKVTLSALSVQAVAVPEIVQPQQLAVELQLAVEHGAAVEGALAAVQGRSALREEEVGRADLCGRSLFHISYWK